MDNQHNQNNGVWHDELRLTSWDGADVIVGRDLDGEVGILDDKGYSIGITARSAELLRNWLNHYLANHAEIPKQ